MLYHNKLFTEEIVHGGICSENLLQINRRRGRLKV